MFSFVGVVYGCYYMGVAFILQFLLMSTFVFDLPLRFVITFIDNIAQFS